MATKSSVLKVEGMTCGSCMRRVDAALRRVEGVSAVEVKLREGLVRVEHDETAASAAALVDAVVDAGYPAAARS